MNDSFFKPHSEESRSSFGRKIAWWILGPSLGMFGGILLGAVIVMIISLCLGEGLGIIGVPSALGMYLLLGAWFFAIMGLSFGIALAINKTSK
jgi:hypothetical protein